jgi:3-dehydroquinate dehydratase/shikimate dehydrogenase
MNITDSIASHLLRSRLGKLCVAITGSTPAEMIARATEVLRETNFIEFRLDYLTKPAAALSPFQEFLAANGAPRARPRRLPPVA